MTDKIKKYFTALSNKNFRIFWLGQCISLIGTWMQSISLPWLSYSLTKSPFLLGLVGALQFTPMLFFSLFAGVFVDKFPKKKIIIITQSTSLIIAFSLSLLVLTGNIKYWHILILALLIGFVNTVDMPARQSFIIELVGKKSLMNAIALNSSVFNLARIIGPAIAGFIMGYIGIGFCFLINSISFIPVILGLFLIKPEFLNFKKDNNHFLISIKDGLKYILQDKLILKTLISVLIMGIFAMNFSVLVPVFAKEILNVKETGFGFLMSCMGVGSLTGAVIIAANHKHGPKNIIIIASSIASSILLIIIGITKNYYISGFLLAFIGLFNVIFFTSCNSMLQLNSHDEYRSRVISVYILFFGGSTPIGNLFTGTIIDLFNPGFGFISCGAIIFSSILIVYLITKKLEKNLKISGDGI